MGPISGNPQIDGECCARPGWAVYEVEMFTSSDCSSGRLSGEIIASGYAPPIEDGGSKLPLGFSKHGHPWQLDLGCSPIFGNRWESGWFEACVHFRSGKDYKAAANIQVCSSSWFDWLFEMFVFDSQQQLLGCKQGRICEFSILTGDDDEIWPWVYEQ